MKIEQAFSGINAHTILLVDDLPVNLGVVVDSLEREGYDVLVAQDGEEALQRARAVMPDLVLLDVMMPGIDGFEVCRRLKADTRTRHIPVIFMTSLNSQEEKVTGFEVGGVDYITKPLQIEEMNARVGTHLELRAMQQRLEEKNVKLQHEIAERKQAEISLQKSFEQIAELNGYLKAQTTQLEAMQELVEQTEAWHRNILHSAPDGMLVVDECGIIMLANARIETLFAYEQNELIGNRIEMLLPSSVQDSHVNWRAKFAASSSPGRPMAAAVIGFGCRKDGSAFPVDVSLSRFSSMDGDGVVFCAAVRAIGAGKI